MAGSSTCSRCRAPARLRSTARQSPGRTSAQPRHAASSGLRGCAPIAACGSGY